MLRLLRSLAAAGTVLSMCVLPGETGAQATPPREERRTLRVNGVERSFRLFVPTGYRHASPAPLLLVFHGAGGRGVGMAAHTGFSRLGEREGVVVVYPDGLDRRWNDGRGYAATHDDVGFVRALLDSLHRELSLDPRRVYATGISNGAMFSYRLACDLPGVFAAVAPVAGAMPVDLATRCGGVPPVAVVAFRGTADPLVPYGGGVERRRGRLLSAERSAAFWATNAGCTAPPATTAEPDRVTDGTRVRHTVYGGCQGERAVELYTIEGGGHTWPGGPPAGRAVGRVTRELDATTVIWSFFARHARP
jgi:polyhydroxybutyrate depolymerase